MLFSAGAGLQRGGLRGGEIQTAAQHLIHPRRPLDRVRCTEQATQAAMTFGGIQTESKLMEKAIDTRKIN